MSRLTALAGFSFFSFFSCACATLQLPVVTAAPPAAGAWELGASAGVGGVVVQSAGANGWLLLPLNDDVDLKVSAGGFGAGLPGPADPWASLLAATSGELSLRAHLFGDTRLTGVGIVGGAAVAAAGGDCCFVPYAGVVLPTSGRLGEFVLAFEPALGLSLALSHAGAPVTSSLDGSLRPVWRAPIALRYPLAEHAWLVAEAGAGGTFVPVFGSAAPIAGVYGAVGIAGRW